VIAMTDPTPLAASLAAAGFPPKDLALAVALVLVTLLWLWEVRSR